VKEERSNILSIESAVAGGSVALFSVERGTILRHDGNDCSRAEKIISVVRSLLVEAGLTLPDLNMIAASTGPGSFSGIRIGLSTALGLTSALNIPILGVSVLDAMANAAECTTPVIAAVPVGKSDVAWQRFEIRENGSRRSNEGPVLMSSASFIDNLKRMPDSTLFAHSELLERLAGLIPDNTTWIDAGIGLAEYVGRFASSLDHTPVTPRPIYLRNSDTAFRTNAF
jgi:tRNA threonylcarbamoyl adenosine modification protein YeaZ